MGVLNELAKAVVRWFPDESGANCEKQTGEATPVCECCRNSNSLENSASGHSAEDTKSSGLVHEDDKVGKNKAANEVNNSSSGTRCREMNSQSACSFGEKKQVNDACSNNNHRIYVGKHSAEINSIFSLIASFQSFSADSGLESRSSKPSLCRKCSKHCSYCGNHKKHKTLAEELEEYYFDLLKLEREAAGDVNEEDLDPFE